MEIYSPLHPWRVKRLKHYITHLSGLIGYWPLWEKDGAVARNYAPSTMDTLNGATTGATVGQEGRVGKAYSFDGANDDVQVAAFSDQIQGKNTLSMMVIAKMSTDDIDAIVALRNGDVTDNFYILKLNDTQVECRWRNSAGAAVTITPTISNLETDWNMFVLTIEGTLLTCYSNGVDVANDNTAAGTFGDGSSYPFYIANDSNTNFGQGVIQHVAFFNTALSPAQILKLAQIAGLA